MAVKIPARKRHILTVGGITFQQHFAPKNFREEIELAIEFSGEPGLKPLNIYEAYELKQLAS